MKILRSIFHSIVLLLAANVVFAAPVAFYNGVYDGVGTTSTTSEAAQWLNTSVVKSFSGDGDNMYGTSGFLAFCVAGSWDSSAAWAGNANNWGYYGTGGTQDGNGAFYRINSAADSSRTVMSIAGCSKPDGGVYAKKDYDHIRIGVMNDTLGTATAPADNTTLKLDVLNSDSSQVLSTQTITLNTALNDHSADIYFFDVLGLQANNRIRITGSSYCGVMFMDEVAWEGNRQDSFQASFTDVNDKNYINPTLSSTTILRQNDKTFSSVIVNAEAADGKVNALSISGLAPNTAFRMISTVSGISTAKYFDSDINGIINVQDLTGLENVSAFSLQVAKKPDVGNGKIFIDFQGVNPTTSSQISPVTATEGGTWNAFEFQAHSGTQTSNPSMELVDSTGKQTSVVLAMNGDVTGWAGNVVEPPNPLMQDYMFVNAGNASYKPISWTLSGLEPGEWYELEAFAGLNSTRDMYFTVEDASLTEEQLVKGNSSASWVVQADVLGEIAGIFASHSTGIEQDWSGLTIMKMDSAVPEPATWALLLFGTFGVFAVRRRVRK